MIRLVRSSALAAALALHAAWALPAPSPGEEICFASGEAGAPLGRCLVPARASASWRPREVRTTDELRAWAKRWFPVGSVRTGWTAAGERRAVRVKAHHLDGDLGIPIVEFDQPIAFAASGPLELRALKSFEGKLTPAEAAAVRSEAQRLWDRTVAATPADYPVEGEIELGAPKVWEVPGASGLRTVSLPMSFRSGSSKDERGSFFLVLDPGGKITFSRFGHTEWAPGASGVEKYEPLFFFRIGAGETVYLLAGFSGPWESWGLVAILDPARAAVVSH